MTDTIDLLETIGRNASLRHASYKELERALELMHASDSLRQAAASGESGCLRTELGLKENKVVHAPPSPGPSPPPPSNLIPPPPPPPVEPYEASDWE